MRRSRLGTALILLGLVAAACGGSSSEPTLSNVRVGQPTGPNGALYFTAEGYGTEDRLIGASSDVADRMEVHETVMNDDGTMGMRHVDKLDLPADGTLVVEPGGYHIMFIEVDRLEVGEVVKVILQWEVAGDIEIEAEVVDPADTGG